MLFVVLLFLISGTAAREIEAVIPVGAEGSFISGSRYFCVTITFELQTVFRNLVKYGTMISPPASSDHILDMDFGKNFSDTMLWCITSPLSQFARHKETWQRVTQCYRRASASPLPTKLTLSTSTYLDLYQTKDMGESLLLLDSDVPLAGKLELDVDWKLGKDDITVSLLKGNTSCKMNSVASVRKCPKGCVDVCPSPGKSNEFVCLKEYRPDFRRSGPLEFVKRTDKLVLNAQGGTLSYIASLEAIPARPRDSFLICSPTGTSKKCHHLSRESICMTERSPCSTISVPENLPPHSVFALQVPETSFVPAIIQPLIDPLLFCLVWPKRRYPKFISLCTRALLGVSKASDAYINQEKLVNGSLLEEGYEGGKSPFVIMTGNESHRGPFPFPGALVLAEISVLTTIVACWLFDMRRRNGRH